MIFVAGIGAAVFAAVYVLIDYFLKFSKPFYRRVIDLRLRAAPRRDLRDLNEKEKQNNAYTITGSLTGAIFGVLLTIGTRAVLAAGLIGSMFGVTASMFVRYSLNEAKKTRMMRELAVLYETIDFLTRGEDNLQHFTIRQALQYGVATTPTIRPIVQRCIDSWPAGPIRALEQFAREVDLPEANILSSVLSHAEYSGMEYTRLAIMEGSQDLEELRQTLAEVKIAGRPLYYTVYRVLPMAGIVGIVVGALLHHLANMFSMFL